MTSSDHPNESALHAENLDHLTRRRAVESLQALVGPEEAERRWHEACDRAGVAPDSSELDDLEQVADELMALSGPIALVGSSLSIRVRTYRMLAGVNRLSAFVRGAS